MNPFDILFALAVLAMGVSLLRARPALLILAANQAITLRSLANIMRFGKPASQGFLPDSIFSTDNLEIATHIFTITIGLTLLFTLLPGRKNYMDPARLPRVPPRLLKLLIFYFVVLVFSQGTIISHTYTDSSRTNYSASFGGGTALLNAVFLYEMIRRTMTGELKRIVGFSCVLGVFIATDYLHGSTGLATGFVIVAAILIFSSVPTVRRTATLFALLTGLFLLALSVRILRSSFSNEYSQGFGLVATSIRESSANEASRGEGLESMGNGTQYAAHVIECIELYEAGVSREWRSIYLPVIYTFEPSFLLQPLGISRPREAAWELGEYFIGGGGIFVVGEFYWNGGIFCVVLVFGAMAWLAWRCDNSYRTGFFWLVMSCNFSANLFQGAGYGFAQVSRGCINGLLMMLIWALVHRFRGNAGTADPVPATAMRRATAN